MSMSSLPGSFMYFLSSSNKDYSILDLFSAVEFQWLIFSLISQHFFVAVSHFFINLISALNSQHIIELTMYVHLAFALYERHSKNYSWK